LKFHFKLENFLKTKMSSATDQIDEKKNESDVKQDADVKKEEEKTELEKANKNIEAGNEKCMKNYKFNIFSSRMNMD